MKNRERIGKLNNDNDQTGRNTIQLNGQCVQCTRQNNILSSVFHHNDSMLETKIEYGI